jgi:hypothetical protein
VAHILSRIVPGVQGDKLPVLADSTSDEVSPSYYHAPPTQQKGHLKASDREHHQNGGNRRLVDGEILAEWKAWIWFAGMFHQANQEWGEFLNMVDSVRCDRVQPDKDNRKEDNVHQDAYDNGNSAPLEPYDFRYPSVDRSRRSVSDTGCI